MSGAHLAERDGYFESLHQSFPHRPNGRLGAVRHAHLAKNVLDDGFDSSPALVDTEMYMRGYRHLYSLGTK